MADGWHISITQKLTETRLRMFVLLLIYFYSSQWHMGDEFTIKMFMDIILKLKCYAFRLPTKFLKYSNSERLKKYLSTTQKQIKENTIVERAKLPKQHHTPSAVLQDIHAGRHYSRLLRGQICSTPLCLFPITPSLVSFSLHTHAV